MSWPQQVHLTAVTLLKHFGIGTVLILAAAAILLISDPRRNQAAKSSTVPKKIAVINYASVPVLDEGEAGLMAGLEEAGLVDGKNVALKRYNAEGDRATAILIAKEVVSSDVDAVITLSTPVLQAVANANAESRKTHIFTLTTDPWGAEVGVRSENHADHPPYMTGHGTLQPVASLFRLAREANPQLKKVGVVWNPSESNSESSTKLAREVCTQLEIELIEVTVDSSSAVLDATKALLGREVEAIWAGGDSTVGAAIDTMISTAREAGVPVFTNMPVNVKQGALFSLGADYFTVGKASGLLAARVIRGESPAGIPVDNFAPENLALNKVSQELFKSKWLIGSDWEQRATLVVDGQGIRAAAQKPVNDSRK